VTKGLIAEIRKKVKEFMTWIEQQCCQEWSCDLRNRMAGHGFIPIQSGSQPKYISVIAAFGGIAKNQNTAIELIQEGTRLGCQHCQGVLWRRYAGLEVVY
jgi:hypothetical protein